MVNTSSLSDSYFAVATHSPTIDHVSYIGAIGSSYKHISSPLSPQCGKNHGCQEPVHKYNAHRTLNQVHIARMSLTLTCLPLPHSSDENFVHVISNLLTPAECIALMQEHACSMIPHDLSLTSRLRKIFDDEGLAETLWNRLEPFYGGMQIADEDQCRWTASRLNTRFRFAKYERG
jgi:hypothetical protein